MDKLTIGKCSKRVSGDSSSFNAALQDYKRICIKLMGNIVNSLLDLHVMASEIKIG